MTIWALVWLGFFFLIGVFRGFWNALATLIAALAAFVGSTLLAEQATSVFTGILPGGPTTQWWIAAVSLFFIIGVLVRCGIKMLGKTLPLPSVVDRLGGGTLGACYGAGVGLIVIWSASVLIESPWLKARLNEQQRSVFLESKILGFSQAVMSTLVAWQSQRAGMPEHQVQLSSTLAAKPSQTLDALRGAVQSPGFQTLMQNEQLKQWAAEGQIEEIAKAPAFETFIDDPKVVELRRFLRENGMKVSREDMAARTAELWGQAQNLQSQPELQAILQDPNLQQFLAGEGEVDRALLVKIKDAISLISNTESNQKN